MPPSLTRQEAERLVNTYADLILRLSYTYLSHTYDAQDICQMVFLKLIERRPAFASSEHEKAWIIRTTINACKDHLKSHWHKTTVPIEAAQHVPAPAAEPGSILASVNLLPPKYRAVIYLHYYEGYTAPEIAQLLGRLPSTVSTQLRRGREQLKTLLEKEGYP
ncbi:MAG: sigma-70 family RNA polymerase sigma factor [Coriobacteriaceae bacterium]|nr:sigma-70 family RNA polymerase sigma factor [Coriobacteriaceae bacterium]